MTAYLNSDGSGLVGALNPSLVGQALRVDAAGNLSVQDFVRAAIMQGKGFIATTGLLNLAAGTYPLSIFNPANSGKSLLIHSVRMSSGGSSINAQLNLVTTNPSFASAASPANARPGSGSSAASATFASTNQAPAGTIIQIEQGAQNVVSEQPGSGAAILLPAGSANGLVAYITTFATGYLAITASWLEF
ncbi:MAG: hypothetical protein J2P36_07525 [Ktedonobacteraceae bacterium]|nr:hypothetical protein [Ktedonobacteraceae bacterium]